MRKGHWAMWTAEGAVRHVVGDAVEGCARELKAARQYGPLGGKLLSGGVVRSGLCMGVALAAEAAEAVAAMAEARYELPVEYYMRGREPVLTLALVGRVGDDAEVDRGAGSTERVGSAESSMLCGEEAPAYSWHLEDVSIDYLWTTSWRPGLQLDEERDRPGPWMPWDLAVHA